MPRETLEEKIAKLERMIKNAQVALKKAREELKLRHKAELDGIVEQITPEMSQALKKKIEELK